MRQADRIIFNTISNYALTLFTMVANFVMLPFVVADLGKSGLGMSAMVLAPFLLFEVLAGSFARSLHRYIPQDLASGDNTRVSRTFTTAMAGYVFMGLAGALSVWLTFDWLLSDADVTPAIMLDGRRALWILIAWLVVGFPLWGYRKGLEAVQRYDLLGFSHGLMTLARTLLVILVFWLNRGSVTFYVTSQLVMLIMINLISRHFMRRAYPAMTERPSLIDKASIIMIGAFAAATLMGMIGEICGSYGFRVLVGKSLGMGSLGALAAILTIQNTMCRLLDELTNSFSPAISTMDAIGSRSNVAKLLLTGTKSSMLAACSMAIVPIAAAAPFLHLWLGKEFQDCDQVLHALLLITLLYSVGLTPTSVLFGLGRVRITGTVMFIRGTAGLLLSLAYVKWMTPSLTGAVLCMLGVQYSGGLWMLYSACKAADVKKRIAMIEVFARPLSLAAIGATATWAVLRMVGDDRFWKLGVGVVAGEIVLFLLILVAGLNEEERHRIASFFTRARSRLSGKPSAVGG